MWEGKKKSSNLNKSGKKCTALFWKIGMEFMAFLFPVSSTSTVLTCMSCVHQAFTEETWWTKWQNLSEKQKVIYIPLMSLSVRHYWKGKGGWGQVVNSQVVFSPELKTAHIHAQIDDRLMAFKTKPDQTINHSISKTHFVLFELISWPELPLFDTMCNRYIRKLRTAKYLFLYLTVNFLW